MWCCPTPAIPIRIIRTPRHILSSGLGNKDLAEGFAQAAALCGGLGYERFVPDFRSLGDFGSLAAANGSIGYVVAGDGSYLFEDGFRRVLADETDRTVPQRKVAAAWVKAAGGTPIRESA